MQEGNYDAIVIAAAGLIRLSRADAITEYFDIETFVPAPRPHAVTEGLIKAADRGLAVVLTVASSLSPTARARRRRRRSSSRAIAPSG